MVHIGLGSTFLMKSKENLVWEDGTKNGLKLVEKQKKQK